MIFKSKKNSVAVFRNAQKLSHYAGEIVRCVCCSEIPQLRMFKSNGYFFADELRQIADKMDDVQRKAMK